MSDTKRREPQPKPERSLPIWVQRANERRLPVKEYR
jgi:hypothetical protein